MFKEIIGTLGSILVLVSMCFNTSKHKGDVLMRITNLAGSVVCVYYGYLCSAYSSIAMNLILVVVNSFYLYKLLVEYK